MKIVIIGAKGQLGRDLADRLQGEVIRFTREDADITDHSRLRSQLMALAPEIVINCSAYNLVDKAEADPTMAFDVNVWGVQNLARVCLDLKARLVHFSTDYVFGFEESRTKPFLETDAPGPVSNYGLSKLTGEHAIRAILPNAMIIRTCGLYGRYGVGGKGGNFVETMKRIGREKGAVRVVNDQHCTPTSTADLALATQKLLETNAVGLLHVTNSGSCTWYEFAMEIFRLANLEVTVTPISTAEFGAPAQRPGYSVLDGTRCSAILNQNMPSWENALSRYISTENS